MAYPLASYTFSEPAAAEPLALVVGMMLEELPQKETSLSNARLETLPYTLLHAALASVPWADCVISPMVSEYFDAMDMATELCLAGFTGTYMVVIPPLPRPDIVRRELCQICPNLNIELVPRTPH